MGQERFFGLQWKLVALYLGASLLSLGAVALGYRIALAADLPPTSALGVGLGAGAGISLLSGAYGFRLVRELKLRLWDAGDLAQRIGQGELSARLQLGALDEIGVLEEQLNQMADYLEQAVGQLSRLAEQNRLLAEEAGRGAALEERARIARDLHDTVNQQLFVLSLRAAAARKQLAKSGGEGAGVALVGELELLEQIAREAHSQTRELILQLRPTTLEQQGLGPALNEYLQATATKEGWQVEGQIDLSLRLRGPEGEALFRIAQEALNNIAKHAQASTVKVELGMVEGALQLRVADDGVGFDPIRSARPTAVGLVGMQERVAALGGQIRLRTGQGQGTELTVTLPKEEAPHDSHHDRG